MSLVLRVGGEMGGSVTEVVRCCLLVKNYLLLTGWVAAVREAVDGTLIRMEKTHRKHPLSMATIKD